MISSNMLRIGNLAVKIGFYLTMKVTKIEVLGEAREGAAVHEGGQFGARGRATARGFEARGRATVRGFGARGCATLGGWGGGGGKKNNAAAARNRATEAGRARYMLHLCSK